MRLRLFCGSLLPLLCFQLNATVLMVGTGEKYSSINSACSAMQPGETVLVHAGKYSMGAYRNKAGTEGKWLTIKNFPGDMPEINGFKEDSLNGGSAFTGSDAIPASYLRIEGFYVTGFKYGITSLNWKSVTDSVKKTLVVGSNIEVRNNVVDLCGVNGLSIFYTKDIVIENNLVSRTGWEQSSWSSGINIFSDAGTVLVRNNISFHHVDISDHHSDGNGFIVDGSYSKLTIALFENNLAFLNGGSGFGTNSSEHVGYVGNTTYNNYQDDLFASRGAAGISFSNTESRNTYGVFNNLCIQTNRGEPIIVYGAPLTTLKNYSNNFTSKNTTDASSIFVNVSNCDFRIQKDATSVIGKGQIIEKITNDIGFDPKAIKKEVNNRQPFYMFAPDIDYIKSKGGLSGCFKPVERKSPASIGAYEYTELADITRNAIVNYRNITRTNIRFTTNSAIVSFMLHSKETLNLKVNDCAGRIIYTSENYCFSEGLHNITIPLYKLRHGMYVIQLGSRSTTVVQ